MPRQMDVSVSCETFVVGYSHLPDLPSYSSTLRAVTTGDVCLGKLMCEFKPVQLFWYCLLGGKSQFRPKAFFFQLSIHYKNIYFNHFCSMLSIYTQNTQILPWQCWDFFFQYSCSRHRFCKHRTKKKLVCIPKVLQCECKSKR